MSLGAGVSVPLDYPSWNGLVDRISKDPLFPPNILGSLPESAPSITTQRLFELFRKATPRKNNETDRLLEERVANQWKRLIAECLYAENAEPDKERKINSHPYLGPLLEIILKSNVVVNFNFDDTIEHALDLLARSRNPKRPGKTYETRWELSAPIRNDRPTIFHPNGYIPRREHEYASDSLVFLEDSFLKRMTMGKLGDDSVWMSEYINNTYIHFGLSLTDEILKSLLQRSWRAAPANVHFQVHYTRDPSIDDVVAQSITDANFNVLNLYTMFLGDAGTASLLNLVNMDDREFQDLCRREGLREKFVFYITGPVGSGKTTSVNHFKNLWAIDEWLEASPDVVSKPYDTLTDQEKEAADSWVGGQFLLKNRKLIDNQEGVFVVDRCSLDPITFETNDPSARAKRLLEQISPGKSGYKLVGGVVFNLLADPYEIRVRLIRKWKFWNEDTIEKLSKDIQAVYGHLTADIDTRGRTLEEVVRDLAKRIFFESYSSVDLHSKLLEICQSKKP